MANEDTIRVYDAHAAELAAGYESLTFEQVHSEVIDLLESASGFVLDVGAGSGRDAAWFGGRGAEVVAVDPSGGMLGAARGLHVDAQIHWVQDRLPGLERTMRLGLSFDLIWLSAVWMHVPPGDRPRAFRKLVSLLKSGGTMMISLRHGTFPDGRQAYPVSTAEIERLAVQHGVAVKRVAASKDRLERDDVRWETVVLQLPDDGTDALPLLRHTILNDSKSSTYKLGLLRILVRIADSAVGMVRDDGDNFVSVPLGLVALYWVRMYKPLVERGIPQMPPNKGGKGLGFVKEAFGQLRTLSPYDLRVGAQFVGTDARWLKDALVDARNTIRDMPAFYITYPNSEEQIFKASSQGSVPRLDSFVLDEDFLRAYGVLQVPKHIWTAMSRFSSWIEPALVSEWVRLMQAYAESRGTPAPYDELMKVLTWLEPERDTVMVRQITQRMFDKDQPVFCVWTGKRLTAKNCDIDHCFPFSAWPCGDLWNLMPADRTVNQRQKGDKLVTAQILQRSADRVCQWWEDAYRSGEGERLLQRFGSEALASLPIERMRGACVSSETVLEGMLFKRAALKRNLQLADWCG